MKPTPLTDQIALDTRVEFGSIEKLLASHRSLERDRAELVEALKLNLEMFDKLAKESKARSDEYFVGYVLAADKIRALLSRLGADK